MATNVSMAVPMLGGAERAVENLQRVAIPSQEWLASSA
jgi:hypothetical protein